MPDNSATTHEPWDVLSPETKDHHRAIASIMEELEAVDWYDQRVEAATDPELKQLLAHNRDEEKEHAAMMLEWLRRRDPELDAMLREFLFKDGPIIEHETAMKAGAHAAEAGASQATSAARGEAARGMSGRAGRPGDGSLGIGSLKVSGRTNGGRR